MAGATPFPHQPEYHPQARSQLRLLLPPGLRLGPPQLPQQGRHPGWRRATNPLRPGRLPPGIPWAWWMKPLLSRTSSKPSPQTSAWQPSAKCCPSRQQSGRPEFLTNPRRKQAARLGARAKAAVRVELRCHHLCPQQGAPSPPLPVMLVTGLCPDSGSLRGLWQRRRWCPRCPVLSVRGPWESKLTSLCTPATLGVGSGRIQINMCIHCSLIPHSSAVGACSLFNSSTSKQTII